MKSGNRQWTREERIILGKKYYELPLKELMNLLPDRTESSIRSQVYYLRKRGWHFTKPKEQYE